MKRNLIIVFWLMASMIGHSQSVMPSAYNSAGGSAVIGGNTYEWAFAEMMLVNTAVTPNVIVTSGVLQPVDPNVGLEEIQAPKGEVNVYPSPTTDLLTIETTFDNSGKLGYQLIDISGKTLTSKLTALPTGSTINTLSLSSYPAGEYLLRILFSPEGSLSKYTQTFKVQKIK